MEQDVFKKEYPLKNGMLIIENIFNGVMSKTDIIKEILENTACTDSEYLVKASCRDIADCGSQTKEVEN